MWLFNVPPTAKVKAKYGFELTKPWLDHVRLSSVRFDNGGSGSFVSSDGLYFTNHHIAAECIHDFSTGGQGLHENRLLRQNARREAQMPRPRTERPAKHRRCNRQSKCRRQAGHVRGRPGPARRAMSPRSSRTALRATKLRCDVVTLYSGAMYHLYNYKKYTDVRLVFAPEFAAAFFGGDPDNFEFPRYDLDVSFFRIYENNNPVHLD